MTYAISWYIENHIIKLELTDALSLEDFGQIDDACMEMMEQSRTAGVRQTHLLVYQKNLIALPKCAEFETIFDYAQHSNFGWTILIGRLNSWMVRLVTLFIQQHNQDSRISMFNRTEAGLDFLRDQDPDLEALPAAPCES